MSNTEKIEIDNGIAPFPKPAVLLGAIIDGKPNFMNLAWMTRISFKPHLWIMSLGKGKYTGQGIREQGKFSINIPGADLVVELDYCGITSGRKVDKSKIFDIFYGKLGDVPMIRECPVCIELTVNQIIEMYERDLIIGEVKHIYTEERFLTDGKLDQKKINQLIYTQPPGHYWTLGSTIGEAFSIGKELKA
ncbi:MAG: flavin reductase family protein [Candidatus Thorarchaeota archaeon]|nr:flavin reductase family protein [Candidatus Thorarchaeota archaeon]